MKRKVSYTTYIYSTAQSIIIKANRKIDSKAYFEFKTDVMKAYLNNFNIISNKESF